MQTEPLSSGISSSKISVKETEPGLFVTLSSGRYNYVIIPAIILTVIISLLIATGAYAQVAIKDFAGIIAMVGIFGGFFYFFQNFLFQQFEFNTNNNTILKNKQQIAATKEVKAIQIVTYHHQVSGNYKIRFEINLVKENGDRIYVFNNSNFEHTVKQAQKLAKILNAEIIDLTS